MINATLAIDTISTMPALTIADVQIGIGDILDACDAYEHSNQAERDARAKGNATLDALMDYKHAKCGSRFAKDVDEYHASDEFKAYEIANAALASAVSDKKLADRYLQTLKRTYLRQCAALITDAIVRDGKVDGIPCHYKKAMDAIIKALANCGVVARKDERGYKNIYVDDMGLKIALRNDGYIEVEYSHYNGKCLPFNSSDSDMLARAYRYQNEYGSPIVWDAEKLARYSRDWREYLDLTPSDIHLACTEFDDAQARINNARAIYSDVVDEINKKYSIYGFDFKS